MTRAERALHAWTIAELFLAPQLCKASGYAFYSTSPFTFERLLADAPNLAANLRAYIAGFSDNMCEDDQI